MSTPTRTPMDRAFLSNDDDATTLILVRHGQQRWPDAGVAALPSEWHNPPLTELGVRQAATTAAYLAEESIDAVYSSQLERAHKTGLAIADRHGHDVTVLDTLEEIKMFGELPAGQTAMDALGPLLLSGHREHFLRVRKWDVYPHTESSLEFRRRVAAAIEGIALAHRGQTVAIACHGGVINAYIAEFLGLTEDMFYRPAHSSVHRVLAKEDRRVILSLNEIRHLSDADALSF
jgi:2,3-bisphosphoglycerate-dependent phosphoglycerate mutase